MAADLAHSLQPFLGARNMDREISKGSAMDDDATQESARTKLVDEFLADHQEMSRLLLLTLESVRDDRFDDAHTHALELNRVAGPHIAFEEAELYPRVSGSSLVSATTRELYAEHRKAVTALKKLLDHPLPDAATKHEIIAGLQTGIDHSKHCGSLARLLSALPEPEQSQSLQVLLEQRNQGRQWTDRVR